MIVGQGPGNAEVERARPFAGISGTRLNHWLADCGADPEAPREHGHLTSVIKCAFAPFGERDFRHMALNCRAFFMRQFNLVQPRLIISLGAHAYEWLDVTGVSYAAAIGQPQNTADYVLVTDLGVHYTLLPWPHPSGRNRLLNEESVRERLRASFDFVRPFLSGEE